ncbi:hypothetical protein PRUPE_2G023400 [Prunus persica]|uniref:Uncharacterized protein n=1 Tax=Prunus persica TaxID=3760 RepID=A0A251Q9U7_PRUPE|nr:hypothetical protein PRUPE_2G023400 [Prunus persica]
MGLPMSPFTNSWIIGLQPDPQPLAFLLSAFGICPLLLESNPMCNVYSLYYNENILLRGHSPLLYMSSVNKGQRSWSACCGCYGWPAVGVSWRLACGGG